MEIKIYCKECHKFIEEIKVKGQGEGRYKNFCKKCIKEHERNYNKSPKGREAHKRYYLKHKKEIIRKHKKWREKNRKRVNEYAINYYRKNKKRIYLLHRLPIIIWRSLSNKKQLKLMNKLCKECLSKDYKTHNTTK